MICHIALPEEEMDFSAEIARHSGDRSLVYREVNGQKLLISLYEPPGYDAAGSYPLLMLVHGGGWEGRKVFDDQADWAGDYLGFLGRYFAGKGWLCASVDYRLMREKGRAAGYELIDLCEDCAQAAAYLARHARELGVDLALTTLPLGQQAFFKAAVLVNAITDLSDPKWGQRAAVHSAHPLLEGKGRAEQIELLSPVAHLTGRTCPALLVHGEEDTVVSPLHSLKYHDRLEAAGVQAQLDLIERTDHAFLLVEYARERGVSLRAAEFPVCARRLLPPGTEHTPH